LVLFFSIMLGLAWLAVLIPATLRARRDAPFSAAERFKNRMELIAPSTRANRGRWVVVPRTAAERARIRSHRRMQRRRRLMLEWGVASVCVTFVVALVAGAGWWNLHLLADAALFSYVVLLVGAKRRREDARRTIRPLVHERPGRRELAPARASGGSGR
jgi:hypothetical protein